LPSLGKTTRSANGFAGVVLPGGVGGVNAAAATVCADTFDVLERNSDARLSRASALLRLLAAPVVARSDTERNAPVTPRVRRLTTRREFCIGSLNFETDVAPTTHACQPQFLVSLASRRPLRNNRDDITSKVCK
jgi:hypothetical protein